MVLEYGVILHDIEDHQNAIAPDGQTIVSAGSPEKEIKLWNLKAEV